MNCCLCNKNTPLFSGKRIRSGYICKTCFRSIPDNISVADCDISYLSDVFMYQKENQKDFVPSVTYGKLSVDDLHFKIGILNKWRVLNIFSIYDLSDLSLCCTNPKLDSHNVATCDVEFKASICYPNTPIQILLKEHIKCPSKRSGDMISWEMPSDFGMFRAIFGDILQQESQKLTELLEFLNNEKQIEIIKAKAALMLPDDFSKDELKQHRNTLIKAFHTDTGLDDGSYSTYINHAYQILKREGTSE